LAQAGKASVKVRPRKKGTMAMRTTLILAISALFAVQAHGQQEGVRVVRRSGSDAQDSFRRDRVALPVDIAEFQRCSLLLGRPTDISVTASVLCAENREGFIEYGAAEGSYTAKTGVVSLPAMAPVEILVAGLQRNRQYSYRLQIRARGDPSFVPGPKGTFRTQRAPGSTFTFEVQGDSHPERSRQHDASLYAQTLRAVAADAPDFYITIGDDFSVDTLRLATREAVDGIYLNQRMFLSLVGQSAALFLVNGNHEQAAFHNLDGTADNIAVRAQTSRNKYFPQPAPDAFYTGDGDLVEFIGPLRDYYAWTWGDALFAVIDPYWHSPTAVDNVYGGGEKKRDLWAITLGDAQYQWLKTTLERSTARYKFVFAHHVSGTGRGGIECADFYEWGGRSSNGVWEFSQKRPGWELPIHQLMARNGVTIFFQGHDHIFVKQEKDGVIYQTLPEPADPNYTLYNREAYRTGDALPNSGRVRVTVSPADVRVEYVRSWLSKDENAERRNNEVAFSYTVGDKAPFVLTSPAVTNGGALPVEFTGDGAAATLPLEWRGVPDGTKSYALIMHHEAPDQTKWYWILYNIPANIQSLPKNTTGIGVMGNNSVNGRTEYAPPHSKGPGPKTYVYTVYALSALPHITVPADRVNRDILLTAIKDRLLGSAELRVVYSRPGNPAQPGKERP
jgi:phosphatidylethanolamine-binding protein (PEBP) family uncharacterized protein